MSIISQFYAALARDLPLNSKVSEGVTLHACETVNEHHGINDFRKNHQGPFVFSFPERVDDYKAAIIMQKELCFNRWLTRINSFRKKN